MEVINVDGLSALAREYAVNPQNYGSLDDFDGHARITGPCGDTIEMWLKITNGTIDNISFTTDGGSSARASGSITTVLAKGKQIEDAASINQQDILKALAVFPVNLNTGNTPRISFNCKQRRRQKRQSLVTRLTTARQYSSKNEETRFSSV